MIRRIKIRRPIDLYLVEHILGMAHMSSDRESHDMLAEILGSVEKLRKHLVKKEEKLRSSQGWE